MPQVTNLGEAEAYLSKFHAFSGAKYDLNKMRELMQLVGNPQKQLKIIHIAGTSGKTSTSYYTAALLKEAGCKVGLTVSPHVNGLNERLQISLKPASESDFIQAFNEFISQIDIQKIKPSWFELMIAFAYWYFKKQKVDYVVIETGLGGLLDATNIADNQDKLCVITDIGLDHTKILGTSLPEIARQKAGIVHRGNVLITHKQKPEIDVVFEDVCARQKAKLIHAEDLLKSDIKIPLYQQRNLNLALNAYDYIRERDNLKTLQAEQIKKVVMTQIPGRMEAHRLNGKTVIFDGAHNKQKMAAFIESYKDLYGAIKPNILLAVKEAENVPEIATLLNKFANEIIVTEYSDKQDTPVNSVTTKEIKRQFREPQKIVTEHDFSKAFNRLLKSDRDIVVVTGSLYLISKIKQARGLA